MTTKSTTKFYSLRYPTAGVIGQYPVRLTDSEEGYEDVNIIVFNGCTYLSNDILKIIHAEQTSYSYITYGRAKFWKLTEQTLDSAVRSLQYPDRNSREAACSARNSKMLDIITAL